MVSQPTLGTVVNNALPGVISVIMIHLTLIHTLVMLCSPMHHFRPHLDTSHQVGTFADYKNVLSGKKQKYHSHRFVNESVLLLANFVRETTRLFLNRCKFVSIIIDEGTDRVGERTTDRLFSLHGSYYWDNSCYICWNLRIDNRLQCKRYLRPC